MLVLGHPLLGSHRLLGPAFSLPPVPIGGDMNTISQSGTRPASPTSPAHTIPNLRAVFDTADWENCRFALAGGQSGNPCTDHFDDLFWRWRENDGVPIAWSLDAVMRAVKQTLRLVPG
jgi:penicillin amidase